MGIAACAAAAVVIVALRSGQHAGSALMVESAAIKRVSLRGEVVCVHCVLHQADDCRPVVRIHDVDHDDTIALDLSACIEEPLAATA